MKEQDLLKAIHDLPDETIEKYALPKSGKSDALPNETAVGKEHIMITKTAAENKKPIRIHRTGIAAAVLICLGLNAGLIYGLAKMRSGNDMIPAYSSSKTEEAASDSLAVIDAMPTGLCVLYRNPLNDNSVDLPKAVEIWQDGKKLDQLTVTAVSESEIQSTPERLDPLAEYEQIYAFGTELPAGAYTLMTFGADGETVSDFGSVDFEISAEYADMIYLPDLHGMQFTDAEQMLKEMGIDYDREDTATDMWEDGSVIMACPAPYKTDMSETGKSMYYHYDGSGYWMHQTDRVTVNVCVNGSAVSDNGSLSPDSKKVRLPDVVGWDFEIAKRQILDLGLYVDKRSAYDDEVPEGHVISTDPAGPLDIEPESYVRVMVSLGPNKDTVIVPNVAGMAFDDAKQILENMGLSAARQDTVSEERAENVISMNVAAGEEVAAGTVITLQVSTGVSRPGMKTVRITFSIPEDAVGSYHIVLNDSGVAAAVGSSFDPQIAAGVAALTVEGTQEADLTAVLVNDTTGAEATIGVYHVNFEAGTSEMVSGSISEAFSAVANET